MSSVRLAVPNHVLPTFCLLCFPTQYCVLHGQQRSTHIECDVPSDSHVVYNPYADQLAMVPDFVFNMANVARRSLNEKIPLCVRRKVRAGKGEACINSWHLPVPMNWREAMM